MLDFRLMYHTRPTHHYECCEGYAQTGTSCSRKYRGQGHRVWVKVTRSGSRRAEGTGAGDFRLMYHTRPTHHYKCCEGYAQTGTSCSSKYRGQGHRVWVKVTRSGSRLAEGPGAGDFRLMYHTRSTSLRVL